MQDDCMWNGVQGGLVGNSFRALIVKHNTLYVYEKDVKLNGKS